MDLTEPPICRGAVAIQGTVSLISRMSVMDDDAQAGYAGIVAA